MTRGEVPPRSEGHTRAEARTPRQREAARHAVANAAAKPGGERGDSRAKRGQRNTYTEAATEAIGGERKLFVKCRYLTKPRRLLKNQTNGAAEGKFAEGKLYR